MRIVLVSPAWRRFDVTRVALAQRRHLCGELAVRGHEATCVVIADDDNLDIADDYGFHTVEQNNDWLGRKFNDGIEHACRALDADVVVPIGSDDWAHPDLFDRLPAPNPAPPDITSGVAWTPFESEIITGRRLAFVNTADGTLSRCHVRTRSGAIPWLIPRQALAKSGCRPVQETQQRGIDFSLLNGLGPTRLVFHDPHDLCRVDFKSGVNLNSYAEMAQGNHEDAYDALSVYYPPELVGLARDLQAVAA